MRCVALALEIELREETVFRIYDYIMGTVNESYDVRGSDLSSLVMMCLTNNGVVSKNRRKQYQYSVQAEVFDYTEQITQELLRARKVEKQQAKDGGFGSAT